MYRHVGINSLNSATTEDLAFLDISSSRACRTPAGWKREGDLATAVGPTHNRMCQYDD
jgi:hypothetical protein